MENDKQRIIEHFGVDWFPLFEPHLKSVKASTNGEASALCPFHHDSKPSFRVNRETGVYYCHGCEAKGDGFSFYGRVNGLSDFPAILAGIAGDHGIPLNGCAQKRPAQRPSSGKDRERLSAERKRLKAVYAYLNLQGLLLFEKVRYEPKSFALRRPDGQGGYLYNMEGISPVLYRLPEVAVASDVWIPEGEKDADALRALGFVATTIFDGASGKWLPAYTEALAGKACILIPDNDEPGRALMRRVAAALHGRAASVRILELPGLPEKGDVSDFIAGYEHPEEAAERLCIMAEGAPAFVPEPKAEEKEKPRPILQTLTALDLVTMEFPEPRWAIPGLIPEGYTLFSGKPKTGKSLGMENIAIAITSGGKALGFVDCEQGGVFFLALEDTGRRLQSRLRRMYGETGRPSPLLEFVTAFPRMNMGGLEALDAEIAKRPHTRLVVIDTLQMFKAPAPKGVNQYEADYEVGAQIKGLADKHGVAIVAIHHLRKAESEGRFDDVSGTFGVTGAADGVMLLIRKSGVADAELHVRGRDVETAAYAMRFDPQFLSWNIIGDANEVQTTDRKQRLYNAIRESDDPLGPKGMAERSGLDIEYVKKMLPGMLRDGLIRKLDRGLYEAST